MNLNLITYFKKIYLTQDVPDFDDIDEDGTDRLRCMYCQAFLEESLVIINHGTTQQGSTNAPRPRPIYLFLCQNRACANFTPINNQHRIIGTPMQNTNTSPLITNPVIRASNLLETAATSIYAENSMFDYSSFVDAEEGNRLSSATFPVNEVEENSNQDE